MDSTMATGSKDKTLGPKIVDLATLHHWAGKGRAVIAPAYGALTKPRPATFVLNWQGRDILRAFRAGLYLYIKPEKKTRPFHEAVRRHGSRPIGVEACEACGKFHDIAVPCFLAGDEEVTSGST